MVTRRARVETNPDGSKKSYQQRRDERRAAEHQRQAEARQQPKVAPETPPALSYEQRKAQRRAQDEGRQIAAEQAAAKAKAAQGPINPYRERARQLESELWRGPATRRRHDHYSALADQWDAKQAADKEAAERQAAIDANPQVKTARDYAAGLVKLAPEQFKSEASEIAGIAQAGDAALAWSRMRDLEQRIWQYQDGIAAEKLVSKTASDADFQAAAASAEASRERFQHAATMSPVPITDPS